MMSLSGNPTILSSTLGSGNIAAMSVLSDTLDRSGTNAANATLLSEVPIPAESEGLQRFFKITRMWITHIVNIPDVDDP